MESEIQKRQILVCGDKGGVGKSTIARTLAEWLATKNAGTLLFDGDDTNPTFTRYFPKAQRLLTKTTKGFEVLINNLEEKAPLQLVDLGAGTSLTLVQFAEKTDYIATCSEFAAKVTFVFALAPSADSIGLLKILSESFGASADYVICRNEANSGSWGLWEGSATRKTILKEYRGIELMIPVLDPDAYSVVDRLAAGVEELSWGKAATIPETILNYLTVQERFASILTACTDEKGVVDKTRLLELLRLSPDDPVTLIVDILISNIEVSGSIIESGTRLVSQTENIMAIQDKQSGLFMAELKAAPIKLDKLLETNSVKILTALDEIRSVAHKLKEESDSRVLEIKRFNVKSAILYFIIGFITAGGIALSWIYRNT